MARKTTQLAKKMIGLHKISIDWYSQNEEDQFILGLANGRSSMLEQLLMEQNCYHGFMYVDKNGHGPISTDHPEYAEWRRAYYIKE